MPTSTVAPSSDPLRPRPLPVVGSDRWYRVESDRPGLELITEPYVDKFLRANLWLIRGETASVLIDCGMGIVPIAPVLHSLTGAACPVILTHGHLDHAGAAHEFAERWGHADDEVLDTRRISLLASEHAAALGLSGDELEGVGEWMLSARPDPEYDPRDYRQPGSPLTRRLADGERIDLGGTVLEVLHLPGHTPGSLALYDRERAELYSGDVIYDGELLDSLPESDIGVYRRSLTRLRELPVHRVLPGHGSAFGQDHLHRIIDDYLMSTA
ncbi:MAG: MBL fold metallo-hydrolase [Leucobacter sp.]